MPNVVLIRAGSTEFDAQERIQGSIDLPLSALGEKEVEELIDDLRNEEINVILASPGQASQSTAKAISDGLGGVKVKEIDGLRNTNQGLWEGLQAEDVKRKYPKLFRQARDSPATICAPEGETLVEVHGRIRKALDKPLKKADTVAIVASEPLATILGCILEQKNPEVSACLCGERDVAAVTRVQIEKAALAEMWDRPISQPNGSNGNGKQTANEEQDSE